MFTLHGIAIDISLALEERHSFTNVLAVSRIIYSLSPVFLIRSNAVEIFTQIANTPPVQAATLDVEGTYSIPAKPEHKRYLIVYYIDQIPLSLCIRARFARQCGRCLHS